MAAAASPSSHSSFREEVFSRALLVEVRPRTLSGPLQQAHEWGGPDKYSGSWHLEQL